MRVGRYCWISTNCIVLNGVSIGDYSIVVAGAVVKGIIPQESLYLNVGDIRKVSKEDYKYMSRDSGWYRNQLQKIFPSAAGIHIYVRNS